MNLKIKLYSFSYLKSGIPADDSGNGGGFVFDCRYIENPGKLDELKTLTGKDEKVIKFIEDIPAMRNFIKNVIEIIDPAIENYIKRNFTDLMISFGCTGGQHRSVYSSEKIKEHINKKHPGVVVELKHLQLEKDSTA
ncbi:MAG: RNase adapter protein RapZ [Ignavibacteria bacterium]|nr:RNase adapter protein RapZ [Ignavibacteria bacterium]